MARAPAGWYADVQHAETERWFDGRTWTDRRRPATGEIRRVDDGRARRDAGASHRDRSAALWLRTVLGGAALAVSVAAVGLLAILVAT